MHWGQHATREAGSTWTQTLYGLPGVIDDTLVVLVRTMRKVHADWKVVKSSSILDSGLTDVHSRVSKLCEHLYVVSLWAWGAQRVRGLNPKKRDSVPIVQMIAV